MFSISTPIGVPVVTPSNTPDRIFASSGSRRWVVKRFWPGLRRSSQICRSGSASGIRGGTPSITQPMAGPWLSPKVVKRNSVPNEFPAIAGSDGADVGRVGPLHADHVITAVDMMGFAGDARRQIRQQIEAGAADIVQRHIALQRRIVLVPLQDIAEIADTRG